MVDRIFLQSAGARWEGLGMKGVMGMTEGG